jgi:D-alanyl-D-alanine carboxypeptidase
VQFLRHSLRKSSLSWIVLGAALAVLAPRVVHAEALLVVEADTGKVLQAENATYPWYPASVTKMMTAYVTLKAVKEGRLSLESTLTVSPVAASQSPSKMGFPPGTQVTVENALLMMMVKSANDMAVVLAEGVAGSVDGFSAQMNSTAQRLGMTQTSYVNPNGLPAEGQVTSARDLAILARAILRDLPEYEYFVHTPSIRFGRRVTQNFNKLIGRYPAPTASRSASSALRLQSGLGHAQRQAADRRRSARRQTGARGESRAIARARLCQQHAVVRPSLGTVDNLVPSTPAAEPARRDVQRQAQAARQRRGRGPRCQCQRYQQRRSRRHLLHRRTAAADGKAVRTDGGGARSVAARRGLHRPEEDRRCPDRRRGRGRAKADDAASRKEVAGRGQETGRRGRSEDCGQGCQV